MHGVPERVLLRHLLAESGGSRREAARRAGVGRSTIYRWIEAGLLDQPVEAIHASDRSRPPVPSKLDPYKPLLQARLTALAEPVRGIVTAVESPTRRA